jgi:hypothetical protein
MQRIHVIALNYVDTVVIYSYNAEFFGVVKVCT